jgi:hypothetical protein
MLISDGYRELQRRMHENPAYGVASVHYAPLVARAVEAMGVDELLDYGAGKGRLGGALRPLLSRPITIHHYDPAVPEWSATPQPCRFVACIDVLEHIEPDLLDNVLDELKRLVVGMGFFTVASDPADKLLPDGRNAHLIQQPAAWWMPRLEARFQVVARYPSPNGFAVLVAPRRAWWQRLLLGAAGLRS